MLQAFARLIADLFPGVDPANVREFLRKHWGKFPVPSDLFATQLPPKTCQGDILIPITFVVQDENGDFGQIEAPGMLLSHSCDLDTDDYVVFAACRPASRYAASNALSSIRSNTVFNLFYLAGTPELGDVVVDFETVQSVRRTVLERSITNGSIRRLASLTTLGYYFLIAKLTVRFLRPQSSEEVRNPSTPSLGVRLSDALHGASSLVGYIIHGH